MITALFLLASRRWSTLDTFSRLAFPIKLLELASGNKQEHILTVSPVISKQGVAWRTELAAVPAAMQPTLEESNSRWWNKVTWMNMSLAWSSGLSSKYKLTKLRVTVSEGAFYLVSHINIVDVSDRDFTCSVVDCFHTLFLSSPTNGWPGSFKYRQRRFTSCSRCSETSILAKRIINNSISGEMLKGQQGV